MNIIIIIILILNNKSYYTQTFKTFFIQLDKNFKHFDKLNEKTAEKCNPIIIKCK